MATIERGIDIQADERDYKRRIWAWTMYDWANSAFATTILAAVLPVYYSQVAGATLPSATVATTYWSYGLSISLFLVAILSPILGTVSDIQRGKKRFLAIFAGIGIVGTALLVLVETGDWVLASILGIIGRIGFNGANTFYDALLPHVARPEDQDKVSARGFAMGYLGGGLLLAVNVVMLQVLPGTWGARLSFLSVAIWWAVFSIPLFRHVPEPPTAATVLEKGQSVLKASFGRIAHTLKDMQQYRQLFRYLIAFLIYNDGIGTIIGVAAIYGAELGFGSVELILALLLVQFVGIPYSLIFGRLPAAGDRRRPVYLAFILFNLIALPVLGVLGARLLPVDTIGAPPLKFNDTATAWGEGIYNVGGTQMSLEGPWQVTTIPGRILGIDEDAPYAIAEAPGASIDFPYNGQGVEITYGLGPDFGIWMVELDGEPLLDADTGSPITVDGYNSAERYGERITVRADQPGEHRLALVPSGQRNPSSTGAKMSIASVHVLPGQRQSDLLLIIGLIIAIEVIGLGLAFLLGPVLFSKTVEKLTTQRSILLALAVYAVIAIWGFFLDSVIEFWFLAWMVAVVQGGSQALSRSLYAALSPASKSGEFFGLFGVMEKFSAIIGPLMFASAGVIFGSSRPAVLSLIVLFILGGYLLMRVDVEAGKRAAKQEDAVLLH